MRVGDRIVLVDDNPFVDVATFFFLEDIADKQGEVGLNNYLISLATSLARSMPEEEYDSWDEFLDAIRKSESVLTTFEHAITPTRNCVVTTECHFVRGILEYTRRIGELSQRHFTVAEYYNNTVKPCALSTCCIICQTYRNMVCKRIKVRGKKVYYAQISNKFIDGRNQRAPDEWLPVLLEKAGITMTKLNMLQRNNDCIWCVYMEKGDDNDN